jgi:hypothetical protein
VTREKTNKIGTVRFEHSRLYFVCQRSNNTPFKYSYTIIRVKMKQIKNSKIICQMQRVNTKRKMINGRSCLYKNNLSAAERISVGLAQALLN